MAVVLDEMMRWRETVAEHPDGRKFVAVGNVGQSVEQHLAPALPRLLAKAVGDDEERKQDMELAVLTPAMRVVGLCVQDFFDLSLGTLLPKPWTRLPTPERLDDFPSDSLLLSVAPIKGLSRMQAKVKEYADEAKKSWPFVSQLGDILRGMIVCGTPAQLWAAWCAVRDGFDVREGHGRLKNNFRLKDGEVRLKKPPDMLINVVVEKEGCMPVVGEIQIHYRPTLELKEREVHLMYEIIRAGGIEELCPKAALPAAAAHAGIELAPTAQKTPSLDLESGLGNADLRRSEGWIELHEKTPQRPQSPEKLRPVPNVATEEGGYTSNPMIDPN